MARARRVVSSCTSHKNTLTNLQKLSNQFYQLSAWYQGNLRAAKSTEAVIFHPRPEPLRGMRAKIPEVDVHMYLHAYNTSERSQRAGCLTTGVVGNLRSWPSKLRR